MKFRWVVGVVSMLVIMGSLPAVAGENREIRERYAAVPMSDCQIGPGMLCYDLNDGETSFDIRIQDTILVSGVGAAYWLTLYPHNAFGHPPGYVLDRGSFCDSIIGVRIPTKPEPGRLALEILMTPTQYRVNPCGRVADEGTTGFVITTIHTEPLT